MGIVTTREREVIEAAVRGFLPADAPVSIEQVTDLGVKFIDDVAANGSERVAEITRILDFLNIAFFGVDKNDRAAVRARLQQMDDGKLLLGVAPEIQSALARFAQRLATVSLYGFIGGDGKPVMSEKVGYKVFDDRGAPPVIPQEPMVPAEMLVLPNQPVPNHEYDAVVVGSGSAGAVIVRRLVERGLDVALVESGDYMPEGRNSVAPGGLRRPSVHDELSNLVAYYKHAGLQITEGQQMFIFQGQCLGGSSVVNNAVCFRMPQHVRTRWTEDFGINWTTDGTLDEAYDLVAKDFQIGPAGDPHRKDGKIPPLNPSGRFLREGAVKVFGTGDVIGECDVNLRHDPYCLGCGYCNITCGFLRKNSVLQVSIPAAVAAAKKGPGKLTIFTGRKAIALETGGGAVELRARAVRVRDRKTHSNEALIRGKKIVISAGAIGSSGILLRTPEVRGLDTPIGERFSMNFGTPIHAEYQDKVNAFEGLQIAHYYKPAKPIEGFVVETWYNPPGTQSLALPGWMESLEANIRRYAFYACAAPLVGSTAKSTISAAPFADTEKIHVSLKDSDLEKIKNGMKVVCDLFFHSDSKAKRILLATVRDWEVNENNFRQRIDKITSFSQLQVQTAHPQGGNCMSSTSGPHHGDGVVNSAFLLHGSENIYVCDASVFPSSLGVNPHWTIMALAELAANEIA
jgi:choline dehydrogenase-like flavoprotein